MLSQCLIHLHTSSITKPTPRISWQTNQTNSTRWTCTPAMGWTNPSAPIWKQNFVKQIIELLLEGERKSKKNINIIQKKLQYVIQIIQEMHNGLLRHKKVSLVMTQLNFNRKTNVTDDQDLQVSQIRFIWTPKVISSSDIWMGQ